MRRYWVIGGKYRDTSFETIAEAGEEWIGPFDTFDEAKKEWAKRAWATVDEATTRYRIEALDPDDSPPCTD